MQGRREVYDRGRSYDPTGLFKSQILKSPETRANTLGGSFSTSLGNYTGANGYRYTLASGQTDDTNSGMNNL